MSISSAEADQGRRSPVIESDHSSSIPNSPYRLKSDANEASRRNKIEVILLLKRQTRSSGAP